MECVEQYVKPYFTLDDALGDCEVVTPPRPLARALTRGRARRKRKLADVTGSLDATHAAQISTRL